MDLVHYFEKQQTKQITRPLMKAGDVVRVEMKVQEGGKTRLQTFEGVVLGVRGSGPSVTFTVRRETGNFGVERIFPLYSPLIESIEIVRRQKVRRARLNYLRQSGRRRFKNDVRAMQLHIKEEEEKKRLAEIAVKKRLAQEAAEEKAAKKAEEDQQTEADKAPEEAASADQPEQENGDDTAAKSEDKTDAT